jgi:prefoldin beta subunit
MAELDPEMKRMYELMQKHLAQMRDVQTKKSKNIDSLHQLGGQRNENELVKDELVRIEPGASVYKLIGPALVSQDVEDAKHVITRRLEHISSEQVRLEKAIAEGEKLEEVERNALIALQAKMQQRQQEMAAKQGQGQQS